jgi:SAM-dependent methyltransferase
MRNGIPMLAPEIAGTEAGFKDASFERLAEVEDNSFWFRVRNDLVIWALRSHFGTASSMIEIGCGTGFVLRGLERQLPQLRLTAGDASPLALQFARSRAPAASLLQLDAGSLPFEEEFDVAGAFDVIEHLDDDEGALTALRGAVRPGGGVLITVPQHPWLWSANDEFGHHRRRYKRNELVGKVRNAGLEVVRVTSFVTLPLPAMAVSRWRQRDLDSFDPGAEYRCAPRLNAWLERCLRLEARLIRRGVSLPAGGSLLLVAQRR